MASKQVIVVSSFHCDVVWRRPPEEQVAIRDRQYTSALDMLEKCPPFRFEFDQATLVREYLDAHPERLEQMRRFVREGRLEITGGEETIPDTNMVCGRSASWARCSPTRPVSSACSAAMKAPSRCALAGRGTRRPGRRPAASGVEVAAQRQAHRLRPSPCPACARPT